MRGNLTLKGEAVARAFLRREGLAFFRRAEPHPADVREAATRAHVMGHMRGGRLTADGVRLALEYLRGAALPPGSIDAPHAGAGGEA